MADRPPQRVMGDGALVDVDPKLDYLYQQYPLATEADYRKADLAKEYSSWLYAPAAAGISMVESALPGAIGGILNAGATINPQGAAQAGEELQAIQDAHGFASGLGTGAGLAEGAIAMGGMGLAKTAATVGLQNAAHTADEMALRHIQEPEGSEKIAATLGTSFLFGAMTAVVINKGFKALGGGKLGEVGAGLEKKADIADRVRSAVGNPGVQADLEAQGTKDTVQAFAEENGLYKLPTNQVRSTLREVIKGAEKDLNQVKAVATETLPVQDQIAFSDELRPLIKGTGVGVKTETPLATTVDGVAGETGPILAPKTIGDLHQLRIKIDKLTNHGDPTSEVSQKLLQARQVVSDYMDKVLAHNAKVNPELAGDQVGRWAKANADYNSAKSLQSALQYAEKTGESWVSKVARKAQSAGETSALFSGLGGNPMGVAAGLATSVAGGAVRGLANGAAKPYVLRGLGKFMQAFDSKVVQTITGGFEKAGTAPEAFAPAFTLNDYEKVKSTIAWITENPAAATPNAVDSMEKAGVPGALIDVAVPQQIKAAQYIKSQMPVDPNLNQTVAPTQFTPTLTQKAKVIEAVNAINDPLRVLKAPTPGGMAALRAVYPILANKAAQIVSTQSANQANMSLAARLWAGQVTGRPGTPLALPRTKAAMGLVDHQTLGGNQQAQQGGNAQNSLAGPSQTRLNRLSQ